MSECRYCPECGTALDQAASRCDCGWRAPRQKPLHNTSDHRCRWTSGADRCPATGTISLDVRGGGPWYCRRHYRITDAASGRRILEDLQAHGVPSEVDWRKQLVDARVRDSTKTLDELWEQLDPERPARVSEERGTRALAFYRRERARCQHTGMSSQEAHERAIRALADTTQT